MKPLITLIVITCAMLAGPPPAAACSCARADLDAPGERERQVRTAFDKAYAVFVADVLSEGPYLVTMQVRRVWKGDVPAVIGMGTGAIVDVDGGVMFDTCAAVFRRSEGGTWLVFAERKASRFVALRCGATMPLQHVDATEAILYQLASPREPAQPPAQPDDEQVKATLERRLEPVAAWRQETADVLRAAASPSAADAALLAARLELKTIVAELTVALETPEFQRLIWPDGAAGQAYRRAEGAPAHTAASDATRADTLVQFMKDRGVWPQRAEGDTYFHASETAMLDWFGPLVSTEIRTFLELWAHEQAAPVAEDASIQVPLDELERRIVATERFLAVFPESPVRDPVRVRHQNYLALYLGGTSNTPAFEVGILRPDLLRRFEAYVAAHDTPSARTVAQYLKLLSTQSYRRTPDVTRFLDALRGDPTRNSRLLVY